MTHRSTYPYGSNLSMRSSISPAALSVKVTAKISSVFALPVSTKYASRLVNTEVFPVPAPATIKSGPLSWVMACFCASFAPLSSFCTSSVIGISLP